MPEREPVHLPEPAPPTGATGHDSQSPQLEILEGAAVIQHWLDQIGAAIDDLQAAYQHPDLRQYQGPRAELNELRHRYAALSRTLTGNLDAMGNAVRNSFDLMVEVDNVTRQSLSSLSQRSSGVETIFNRTTIRA